ncbi:O-antigen ligase family protein [Nocardioides sp. zg-1228]|uniref:O-antigen ligase family protein n=1 Tax=Nocardioides sp. zg-1228 TaxID=2763008 RepID=UPI0016425160|nr:O-antigen ligase family protein [Nocardioides sp. zg-1228]MBC2931415.1 O-antigen ligase family protein [Nocardioides sp. zg-1228]QSF57031.1 O-antigen ligase family protein [Nocardioides sp. zg-1228]
MATRPHLLVGTDPVVADVTGARRTLPAVHFLCAYVVLLLGLPSVLIFAPLGSPGTPANIWGLGILLWWVLATLGGQNRVSGLTWYRVVVGAFAGTVLMSYASAMAHGWYSPGHLRRGISDWTLMVPSVTELADVQVSAADRGLVAVFAWVGITLLAAEGLRTWQELERVITWLAALGAFMAVLGLVQYLTGFSITSLYVIPGLSANSEFGSVASRSVVNRVSATAAHPIEFGVIMAALLPLSLHRTVYEWGNRWALTPTILIAVSAGLSVSRSAVVSTIVALVVILVGWPNKWRIRALVLLPFAIVAMRGAFPGLLGTIYALFANLGNDPSISGRTTDYDAVSLLWSQGPVLGRGFFTFVPQFYRILDNMYLLLLLELGIVGLLCTIVLFVTGFLSARAARSRAPDERSRHLGLCLSASLLGLFVALGTFDALVFSMTAGALFLLLGLSAAAWRLSRQQRTAAHDGR